MRLLLIAYEFPPLESAQALRWGYLARELARRGHELDVVTANLLPDAGPLLGHPRITIHPVFAGPFVGFSAALRRRLAGPPGPGGPGGPPAAAGGGLAERAYRLLRAAGDQLLVPDVRSEWVPWATRAARRLLAARAPDLLLTSHEPGASLLVALRLRRRARLPWLADLGDPVVTGVTPRWRRAVDRRLERRALRTADRVVVTTESTRTLLAARHGLDRDGIALLPQGFDEGFDGGTAPVPDELPEAGPEGLQLLFTGTLYAGLRDPRPLLAAMRQRPSDRLLIAGAAVGVGLPELDLPPNVRFLGKLGHAQVLAMQRRADVLVNVGNDNAEQVPGKLFEYFGAARPILYLRQHADDAGAALLDRLDRGRVVANETGAIAAAIDDLATLRAAGELDSAFDLDAAAVAPWSWTALGERLDALCRGLAA